MSPDDFRSIVDEHTDLVYGVAYRMMSNAQDAEDVTQETFLSAFRHWDSFRGGSSIGTWLYRIAVNACLMRLRKEKRARASTVDPGYGDTDVLDWAPDPSGTPEELALNSELRDELVRALAELPSDLRAAVVLRDVQGLSNAEASAVLDISVPSMKAKLHRGRVLLRRRLEEYARSAR
ncbi:MAG: RNA polymerase sigma factor [Chloroflexota bacterium]|nr:RNA polymerase sigma factor [Chloroflexota bacterium]MDE2941726.1 RNA polymerase sigma factor [Chloroflexota bacterium]MDE3268452.1 RNA polymerase sigma factor [Chloroflexota bacterium]